MIIRCPHCDHTRTINTDKIPANAELATCPKCKNRFRFRALEKADTPVFDSSDDQKEQSGKGLRQPPGDSGQRRPLSKSTPQTSLPESAPHAPSSPSVEDTAPSPLAMPEVQRPQSAFREVAEQTGADVWDAVDALHQHWESKIDQHVTEVITPRPAKSVAKRRKSASRKQQSFPDSDKDLITNGATDDRQTDDRKADDLLIAGQTDDKLADDHLTVGQMDDRLADDQLGDGHTNSAAFPAMSDLYDSVDPEEEMGFPKQDRLSLLPDTSARTLVNYAEQGSSPEDIVDQDIKIMRHSSAESLPVRDLGKLKAVRDPVEATAPEEHAQPENIEAPKEFSITEEPDNIVQGDYQAPQTPVRVQFSAPVVLPQDNEEEESQVPWENQEEFGGWFKALLTTIYFVMLRGPSFYANIGRIGAPLSQCYLFFLIMGYLAIISSVLWAEIALLILQDAAPLVNNLITLPILLVVAPLALGLMQLFVTGCMRLQLKILAPDRADFVTSYRITAYSVAPFVMCLVPFVGPTIAAVWFAFALTTGCRYAIGLSWGMSVAVTIPPAGLLIGGICWFFLA